jgi:pre-mRNA-processing factor 6
MSGGYSGTAQQSYAAIKARQLAPPVPVYIPGKVPAGTPVPPPNRGPAGYVAGMGRGATGFTTRSDIGPAKNEGAASSGIMPGMMPGQPGAPPGFGQAPAGYQAGRGAGRGQGPAENDNDRGDYSDANFDKFNGFSGSLFNGPVDAEDEAADNVWNLVEDIMDSRRKTKREAKERAEMEEYRRKVPTIQRQFADLKRQMKTMDGTDWLNIPEAGELARRKHKTPDRDFFTPVPDSLLDSARKESEINTSIDPRTGMMTPAATPLTDLTKIGEGRSKMLELKLQRVSDSVTGQTVVDPKGYLTGLNSVKISTQAEIGDFKEGRLLLNSAIQSNKNHAPSWIAAARLEVLAGKVEAARTIILDGCKNCPTSKDIWVEAAVLHPNDAAKRILAQAITHLPEEVAIWMRAAELELDVKNKRKVLRAALQQVPNSVRLWKAAVELEDETAARAMLTRAVEDGCCPLSVDLWLALAQLQPYEEARATLTRAREKLPSEPSIWLTAAKLEEANNHLDMVPKIIEKCLNWFSQQQIKVAGDRDHWLKEAETAESETFLAVAEALISVSISIGVHTSDRKRIFIADAESMLQRDKCAPRMRLAIILIFMLSLQNSLRSHGVLCASCNIQGQERYLDESVSAGREVRHAREFRQPPEPGGPELPACLAVVAEIRQRKVAAQ